MANRIPLKPQGFNITIAVAIISLFAKAKNITKKQKKRESFTEFCNRVTLSSVFIASFAFVLQMHRAAPIPLSYFSAKNITHSDLRILYFRRQSFLYDLSLKNVFTCSYIYGILMKVTVEKAVAKNQYFFSERMFA